jgi:acetone carboxylase gamma subunit
MSSMILGGLKRRPRRQIQRNAYHPYNAAEATYWNEIAEFVCCVSVRIEMIGVVVPGPATIDGFEPRIEFLPG